MRSIDTELKASAAQNGLYYLHGDHLGTATFVTDDHGEATQFFVNLPFGETLIEQQVAGKYSNPYKFNAKKLDSETALYYYGARYYNPRLSIWYGVDPLAEKYPSISPYAYVANNPINAIDPDGKYIIFLSGKNTLVYSRGNFYYANMTRDKQGNYSVINTGRKYDGRKDNVSKTLFQLARAYRNIEKSDQKDLKGQLHTLEKSKNIHLIKEGSTNAVTNSFNLDGGQRSINAGRSSSDSQHTKTEFDFSNSSKQDFLSTEGVINTNETTVIHEMRHQYDYEIGNMSDNMEDASEKDPVEIRGVYNENLWRKANSLPIREKYGNKIDPKLLKNPPNNKNPK